MKKFFQNNWKFIVAALSPLALIAIIFALPLKTVPVPVTETYYETEIKSEPYTVAENYTEMEPYTASELRTDTLIDQAVGYGTFTRSFQVDQPGATVTVEIANNSYGYSFMPRYYIIGDNYSMYPYDWRYSPWYWDSWNTWGAGQSWATVKLTYSQPVTKYREVTKTREVTKYRDVPTQVKKERTAVRYVKMSMWESMFR